MFQPFRFTDQNFVCIISYKRAIFPAYLMLLYLIILISSEEYKLWIISCFFFSLLGPDVFLETLFSNTLNLSPYLNVWNQVLHPYETTGKIIF
jgi:hypothetical protein